MPLLVMLFPKERLRKSFKGSICGKSNNQFNVEGTRRADLHVQDHVKNIFSQKY